MDRLLAGRKKPEPTAIQSPPSFVTRRALIAGGVVAAAAGAFLAWRLFFTDPAFEGPESLAGLHVDDPDPDDLSRLGQLKIDIGRPWALGCKAALGEVLTPDDLKLNAAEMGQVKARWTADDSVCVLSSRGKVFAVVVRQGGTGRGLKVGNDVNKLMRLYPEGVKSEDRELPGGSHVVVHRYDKLGVGFETRGKYVVGITLYPPARP